MVKTTFRSNTMSQFLEDPNNYNNSLYWSRAFTSRLRDSIEESYILSFLTTNLDGENNYARVWNRIEKHILSTDIKMARVMTNWISLLSSKCEDRNSFLSFYPKTKVIVHKLIKVFFLLLKTMSSSRLISWWKLKRKNFKRKSRDTYGIRTKCTQRHWNCFTQTLASNQRREHLRDTTMNSGLMDIVRKVEMDDSVSF